MPGQLAYIIPVDRPVDPGWGVPGGGAPGQLPAYPDHHPDQGLPPTGGLPLDKGIIAWWTHHRGWHHCVVDLPPHYPDQGLAGAEQATMTGLTLGGIYAWRKEIWLPMIVHAAYDLAAILFIYMGWEEAVARLIFP